MTSRRSIFQRSSRGSARRARCTPCWKRLPRVPGASTELVKALKTYTYLDRAPLQSVDVHEGLNSTLVMLRSKLKHGIIVRREYAPDLPHIEAYASELNQVWTNIIDNAADAMDGKGEIVLRTRPDGEHVVVEIEDNGPGIPAAVQPTSSTRSSRPSHLGSGPASG